MRPGGQPHAGCQPSRGWWPASHPWGWILYLFIYFTSYSAHAKTSYNSRLNLLELILIQSFSHLILILSIWVRKVVKVQIVKSKTSPKSNHHSYITIYYQLFLHSLWAWYINSSRLWETLWSLVAWSSKLLCFSLLAAGLCRRAMCVQYVEGSFTRVGRDWCFLQNILVWFHWEKRGMYWEMDFLMAKWPHFAYFVLYRHDDYACHPLLRNSRMLRSCFTNFFCPIYLEWEEHVCWLSGKWRQKSAYEDSVGR